jgi:hypothetical protein
MSDPNDFDSIRQQVKEFGNKVAYLKQAKAGMYSAKLELPRWEQDGKDFATQVSAQIGRFTGRLSLLEQSPSIPVEDSKIVLIDLSGKIKTNLQLYAKQWGDKHEKDFCDRLQQQLDSVVATIQAYSRPNAPRPR